MHNKYTQTYKTKRNLKVAYYDAHAERTPRTTVPSVWSVMGIEPIDCFTIELG